MAFSGLESWFIAAITHCQPLVAPPCLAMAFFAFNDWQFLYCAAINYQAGTKLTWKYNFVKALILGKIGCWRSAVTPASPVFVLTQAIFILTITGWSPSTFGNCHIQPPHFMRRVTVGGWRMSFGGCFIPGISLGLLRHLLAGADLQFFRSSAVGAKFPNRVLQRLEARADLRQLRGFKTLSALLTHLVLLSHLFQVWMEVFSSKQEQAQQPVQAVLRIKPNAVPNCPESSINWFSILRL